MYKWTQCYDNLNSLVLFAIFGYVLMFDMLLKTWDNIISVKASKKLKMMLKKLIFFQNFNFWSLIFLSVLFFFNQNFKRPKRTYKTPTKNFIESKQSMCKVILKILFIFFSIFHHSVFIFHSLHNWLSVYLEESFDQ